MAYDLRRGPRFLPPRDVIPLASCVCNYSTSFLVLPPTLVNAYFTSLMLHSMEGPQGECWNNGAVQTSGIILTNDRMKGVRATLPYCSQRDSASYLARLVPLVTSGRLILDC